MATRLRRLKKDIEEVKKLSSLRSVEADENSINFIYKDQEYSLLFFVDDYPNGTMLIPGEELFDLPLPEIIAQLTEDDEIEEVDDIIVYEASDRLIRDIELYHLEYQIRPELRVDSGIREQTVILHWWIPLTKMTAKAWGASIDEPIRIKLRFSTYDEPPNIEFQQEGNFQLKHQLTFLTKTFISKSWRQLYSDEMGTENGLLVALVSMLNQRCLNLNDYCIICDQKHLFAKMMKPSVCTRGFCSFTFEHLNTFGRIDGSQFSMAVETSVIDLLVQMAIVAANSRSAALVMDPFPCIGNNIELPYLTPAAPDYERLKKVINTFPKVSEILSADNTEILMETMMMGHRYAWSLFQWIISSNRSHLVRLRPEHRLRTIGTAFQYLMISSSPEKEAEFQRLKKEHGSVFGYHGSPTQNWHSILRNGLKAASGTKLQRHGAVHGNGVYISTTAAYSMSYSYMEDRSHLKKKSECKDYIENAFTCIALCEVLDINIKKYANIWVVPDEAHVATRFLFVYNDQNYTYDQRSSTDDGFIAEVNSILEEEMG